MSKWLVTLKAEVKAENIKEAREKALGVMWNTHSIDVIKLLEYKRLGKVKSK